MLVLGENAQNAKERGRRALEAIKYKNNTIRIADALGTSLDEMREECLKQEKVDRTNF